MANKKDLKEVVRNYILENYSRLSEEDKDQDGIEDEVDAVVDEPVDDDPSVEDVDQAYDAVIDLLNSTGQRINSVLRRTDSRDEKVQILNRMVDFILNGFNTREDLPNSMLRDFFIKKFGGQSSQVDEMSTTAGAPAPATKYAFKRKKK